MRANLAQHRDTILDLVNAEQADRVPEPHFGIIADKLCGDLEFAFHCGALASMGKSAITTDFARQALRDLIRTHELKPDIEMIQKTVSDFFQIRLVDLKSKKRTQHIAFCRQVAMHLCRKMTDSSFPAIGEAFGRDHSTVIHAHNLIARRIANDSAFRFSIEKIERELKATHANAA
jgi:chromosomal replication initiation ATPase DnaA